MSRVGQITEDEIREQWPLHWLVWTDSPNPLDRLLAEKQNSIEGLDPRGRTPLHLAVALGRLDCVAMLLKHGANTLATNRHHWSVLNEAVCTGNPELIGLVLQCRDQQQKEVNIRNIPTMLERLQSTADYYIEMKWEFSSWVPLVSRMCPSDTCKIWKKGTTVRVDTSLLGFQNMRWQRGQQTLIFEATSEGHRICDINHGEKSYWSKEFKIAEQRVDPAQMIMSHELGVVQRLSAPVVCTHVDTDDIAFQRQKSGIWGFRSEKVEQISGYSAKVFTATGLNIKTNTRVEHLPESEKKKQKSVSPLQDFMGAAQNHASNMPAIETMPTDHTHSTKEAGQSAGSRLTLEQYFTEPNNKEESDCIGRVPEVTTKTQKLKATVCLAENFPLDLRDQVMPIIDLMAMNTPHFAKVKDFINLQMPSGFPVRFEIPFFHLMSAKVTFGNVNSHSEPVPHVSLRTEERRADPVPVYTPTGPVSLATTEGGLVKQRHGRAGDGGGSSVDPEGTTPDSAADTGSSTVETQEVCTISEECFQVPPTYRRLNTGSYSMANEEEELLQLAIRQSLLEQGGGYPEEQLSLREALGDQTLMGSGPGGVVSRRGPNADDEELEFALALSRHLEEEKTMKRRHEEEDSRDEELQRILKLSLEEK